MPRTWNNGRQGIPDDQIESHFWTKVNKNGPVPAHRPELGPCWIWTDGDNGRGYGQFTIHRVTVYAHRFAFEVTVGPIPDGALIRHHCDNGMGGCVRPDHMTTGTPADNNRDAIERGRFLQKGCRNGHIYAETGLILAGDKAKKPGKRSCYACVMAHRRKVSAQSESCQGVVQTNRHRGRTGEPCGRKVPIGQQFCYSHQEGA